MKKILALILLASLVLQCKKQTRLPPRAITKVQIETIYKNPKASIRAIEILDDGSLAFAATHGLFGLYDSRKNIWQTTTQENIQEQDTLRPEFRATAHTASDFFMLSTGSPALLYKTNMGGNMQLVYTEKDPEGKVFYDAMTFWNNREGIAVGDNITTCMSIIITRDGGHTWHKIPCDNLPQAAPEEVAFAASNTNIVTRGNHTWIATGGGAQNILYSPDKGVHWQTIKLPLPAGVSNVYSIDFYDEKQGFAIGGNYKKPTYNTANKLRTLDGGKTWQVVGKNQAPGYRSCVQYVPRRGGKELVAVGFEGVDFSVNGGNSWKHLSSEGFYTIRFLNDSIAYAAGQGRISKLTFLE